MTIDPVTRALRGDIALITIDNPPVNAASQAVREGLKREVEAAIADSKAETIVIACAGRTFTAGADIREFGKTPLPPILFEVLNVIEASTKPVVAAIQGTALGGGFEICLAAHRRVIAPDAKIGLPEVKLGLIPGAGGTQRTPRLCGLLAAIDIVTSGRMVPAKEALSLGLVDVIAEGDLVEVALAEAAKLKGQAPRRTGSLPVPPVDAAEAEKALAAAEKKARGQISPGEAARAVLKAPTLSVADGVKMEREIFLRLTNSDQGKALRHVFFAERDAAKVPGLEGVAARKVTTIGVAGAGTMGSGISVALADAGYAVINVEQNAEAAGKGRERTDGVYGRLVKSGRLTEEVKAQRMGRITFAHDLSAFAPCDLIIEAVFDDMGVKQELFRKLSAIVRPDCILATNTSYLDPNEIAKAATNPERVVGMHFFSPANLMRLLEVVRAEKTVPDVLATALAVGKKLGKLTVVAGVCDGFIGNRIYANFRKQCEYMLEDGALPQEVDAAMESFGLPMGPFAVNDLSGLDIAWARRKRLASTRDPRERYVAIADTLCEMGRLGQKTGSGFYNYENGKRVVDPVVTGIVEKASADKGITRRTIGAEEIRMRIIAAMVNEGAKILAEGIAARPSDIDLVFINGYGWPAWLGGPMFQADLIGPKRILDEVRKMQTRDGFGWDPAPLLVKVAEGGGTFAELNAR
jgi:3-hydroxyacyl-CoA dehydrogenase